MQTGRFQFYKVVPTVERTAEAANNPVLPNWLVIYW